MRRKGVEKYSDGKKIFSVLVFIIIFLIVSISPKSVKADSKGEYINYFYVSIINNVLPIIKSSNTEEQYTNSKINMGSATLSFLGLDISNPISIIAKEISYLDTNKVSADINNESNGEINLNAVNINPFKLEDKQVSKLSTKSDDSNLIATLDNPTLKKALSNAKRVLIYHSHTSEAYRTSENDAFINSSLDNTKNICAVGDVVTEELEKKYGISVIHDKTVHDTGNYKTAYKKSRVTLDKYLKEFGDFDLIIDMHRDGVTSSNKNVTKTKINGEDVAKFMFVMTQGNPRYSKQKKIVSSMVGISKKIFPGLLDGKEMYLYNRGVDFYSQDRSNNAVLIEVGDNNNTIEQAKNTGKYLSRIIAEQLKGIK